MVEPMTQMRSEILEIPDAVDRLFSKDSVKIQTVAAMVREKDPRFLISVARGSSDHACTYLKYASELLLGLPMASVGPSIHSIYGANLLAKDALCLSVSQSGQSPDIVSMTRSLRNSGALTVAVTNNPTSQLAETSQAMLSLHTGAELSVAATKTFVNSIVVGLWLLAEIKEDADLLLALRALPECLKRAAKCDWTAAADAIDGASVYTLGRGPSSAISDEAALKFKETCMIHAESYSSAEVLHGPVSIVKRDFPVIAFAASDLGERSLAETADALAAKGARVFATTDLVKSAKPLARIKTGHPLTDPIATIVSFYAMVEALSRKRGLDPDTPRHLNKVTETV